MFRSNCYEFKRLLKCPCPCFAAVGNFGHQNGMQLYHLN